LALGSLPEGREAFILEHIDAWDEDWADYLPLEDLRNIVWQYVGVQLVTLYAGAVMYHSEVVVKRWWLHPTGAGLLNRNAWLRMTLATTPDAHFCCTCPTPCGCTLWDILQTEDQYIRYKFRDLLLAARRRQTPPLRLSLTLVPGREVSPALCPCLQWCG